MRLKKLFDSFECFERSEEDLLQLPVASENDIVADDTSDSRNDANLDTACSFALSARVIIDLKTNNIQAEALFGWNSK